MTVLQAKVANYEANLGDLQHRAEELAAENASLYQEVSRFVLFFIKKKESRTTGTRRKKEEREMRGKNYWA